MKFKFFTTVRVRYSDTDAQGHVYFANYLAYFDIATTDYMKAIGYSYERLLEQNLDFFTIETLCRYKGRAFFDEKLKVMARISNIGNSSFRYDLAIVKEDTEEPVAEGYIVNVMIDKTTETPTRVPDDFRKAVQEYESTL